MKNRIKNSFDDVFKGYVDLTDDLIKKLVQDGEWGDEEHLKAMRQNGFKWNPIRKSLVSDTFKF